MFEALSEFLAAQVANHGYLIVFVTMLVENSSGIGSIFPGDTILLLAGFYARSTELSLSLLIAVGITGAVLGDNLSYVIGRYGGQRLINRLEKRWKSLRPRIEKSRHYFQEHGGKTVMFGRNVAVVRTFIPLLAGVGKMPYPKFALYNFIGVGFHITAVLVVGYFFGQYRDEVERIIRGTGFVLLALVVLIGYLYWRRRRKRKKR